MINRQSKIPGIKETRKIKHKKIIDGAECINHLALGKYPQISEFTIEYLNSIGVPTEGLTDPVKVILLDFDRFKIIKDGKES